MRCQQIITFLGFLGAASAVPCPQAPSGTESAAPSTSSSASTVTVGKVDNNVLILARDDAGAFAGSSGLDAYGIPWQKVTIPQAGATLPPLNSSSTDGKFSAIIIVDAVSYQYTDGWRSAITTDQWASIHKYQTDFGVRMVRINEYPGPDYGATVAGDGCCGDGVEQLISFTDTSAFKTANLKT